MHDLRMAPGALAAWGSCAWLVTCRSSVSVVVAVAGSVLAVGILRWLPGRAFPAVLAAVCVVAVATSCAWRLTSVEHSPLTDLARQHRVVTLDVEVRRDAHPFTHLGRPSVVVEVVVRRVVARDVDVRLRDHATAFVDGHGDGLVVGRRLVMRGRLSPADSSDEAALVDVVRTGRPDRAAWWWEASERVREGVRQAVSPTAAEARALVPALVDGDDGRVSEEVRDDFQRSGLTHLLDSEDTVG